MIFRVWWAVVRAVFVWLWVGAVARIFPLVWPVPWRVWIWSPGFRLQVIFLMWGSCWASVRPLMDWMVPGVGWIR